MTSTAAVSSLRRRISEMQPVRIPARGLPTHPALRPLFPSGSLRAGASYTVLGSTTLAFAMLSEASAAGAWCGAIGFPDLGAEAAAALGIALDRCVLIPDPGEHLAEAVATLSEALGVIVIRPTQRFSPATTERLTARLREHGSALVVAGDWPRSDSRLRVTGSSWTGLGQGTGRLRCRELSVDSHDRRGLRSHTIRFSEGRIAAAPPRTVTSAPPQLTVVPA